MTKTKQALLHYTSLFEGIASGVVTDNDSAQVAINSPSTHSFFQTGKPWYVWHNNYWDPKRLPAEAFERFAKFGFHVVKVPTRAQHMFDLNYARGSNAIHNWIATNCKGARAERGFQSIMDLWNEKVFTVLRTCAGGTSAEIAFQHPDDAEKFIKQFGQEAK